MNDGVSTYLAIRQYFHCNSIQLNMKQRAFQQIIKTNLLTFCSYKSKEANEPQRGNASFMLRVQFNRNINFHVKLFKVLNQQCGTV